jgi:hypothetical protein
LRRGVYAILIAVSAGAMIGRILAVDAIDKRAIQEYRIKKRLAEQREAYEAKGWDDQQLAAALNKEEKRLREAIRHERPFLSANDRSRWCAVRALVEEDMRVPGVPYAIDNVIQQPGWDTIDMVKHDGHLYSSKPPLWPTLLAGQYWIIHKLTGANLGDHPYAIGRFMLILNNVVGWVVALVLIAAMAERLGKTDWGRIFVVTAASFGTFLTTFAVVLNNHMVGAVSVTVTLYALMKIWVDGRREIRWFVLAGLFGAFTVANELPALSLLALLSLGLLLKAPRQTLIGFAPMAVLVGAGFLGTNWIAHHSPRPPYSHRTEGDNWYDYSYERNGRVIDSYWRSPTGLDRGEKDTAVYVFHGLVGHHGVFSLTPMWLLTVLGIGLALRPSTERSFREIAAIIAVVTITCLVFYLVIERYGRNYGGGTSGLRWVFWMAPLWLITMLPAVDLMSKRRWTIAVAIILLGFSVLSVSFPTWNPWSHPWIYQAMDHYGWLAS